MQTLLEQALSIKLMEEVNANIQLRMQLLSEQEKVKGLENAKPQSRTSSNNGSQSHINGDANEQASQQSA